ncbi:MULTISPECIES: LacI family DNA-binding transcriptional regulator [unclassified Nonomuraea]|uniref:LacI family DNA-binding transcriptional regulator n=1 Tax=unclassified Nonomuraea TaxID=2593643 RepID=UPI0033E19D81
MAQSSNPGNRRPTVRDVAKLANVSMQTVSNVLHNRSSQMTPETRARVEQAMKDLAYHPNAAARGLRSSSTRTFGFLLLDEAPSFMADPLTSLLVAGVGDIARDEGYELLLRAERPLAAERSLVRPLHAGRVDGAVVLMSGEPGLRQDYIGQLAGTGVPFVLFDEVVHDTALLSVRTDERQCARRLTEHLLAAGHQRIAFIAAKLPWAVVEQRHLGYRDALAAAGRGVSPHLELFEATWQADGGERMARRLLELADPPSAIMCASDVLAIGAIHTARELGRRVPDDVAICGFDDFEFSRFVDPPLTTVRVPAYEMGRKAAGLLLDRLAGRPISEPHVVLSNQLVLRASA